VTDGGSGRLYQAANSAHHAGHAAFRLRLRKAQIEGAAKIATSPQTYNVTMIDSEHRVFPIRVTLSSHLVRDSVKRVW